MKPIQVVSSAGVQIYNFGVFCQVFR